MRLALYQPDIPQNTGAVLRLAAGFGCGVDLIHPLGFQFDEPRMRRAGMDYIDLVSIREHASWETYLADRAPGRLVLLTTKAAIPYWDFAFDSTDSLLLGRESGGVPDAVHEIADARLLIPLKPGIRSLNMAMAAGIVTAEAKRQFARDPKTSEPA